MTKYWEPTADNYLARVPKPMALEAVTQACGKDAAAKIANLKRDPLAKEAAKLMKGKKWLPEILRVKKVDK